MPSQIVADVAGSISELKKNPAKFVQAGNGYPVAVLNRNHPEFYCVPAPLFESMMDQLEDLELAAVARDRIRQKGDAIPVKLDDL